MSTSNYKLSFNEAIEELMTNKKFIRSNIMAPGVYLKLDSYSKVVVKDGYNIAEPEVPFIMSKNSYTAKWNVFSVANKAELELDNIP